MSHDDQVRLCAREHCLPRIAAGAHPLPEACDATALRSCGQYGCRGYVSCSTLKGGWASGICRLGFALSCCGGSCCAGCCIATESICDLMEGIGVLCEGDSDLPCGPWYMSAALCGCRYGSFCGTMGRGRALDVGGMDLATDELNWCVGPDWLVVKVACEVGMSMTMELAACWTCTLLPGCPCMAFAPTFGASEMDVGEAVLSLFMEKDAGRCGRIWSIWRVRRRLALFQWFLIALSVRPGSSFAISAQRLPTC
eukprot:scaffold320_cov367-Pinguiococcus_pyrenoidosus.AAC.12